MLKKAFLIIVIILLFFGIGFSLGRKMEPVFEQPEELDMSLFWQAWQIVQDNYVDQKEIDKDALIRGAIKGMISALEDDHSVFLEKEEVERFLQDTDGFFEGVGMEIGVRENQLQVIAPLPDTPAEKAGLLSGDKIIKIDGKSTTDMIVEEAVSLIRGERGTFVLLTILRKDWKEPRDFQIQRDVIQVPSLQKEIKNGNILYLRIFQFNRKAEKDFSQLVNEVLKKDIEGIILDLRGNPGGYLQVSVNIAKWFLEENDIITIEQRRSGEEIIYRNDKKGQLSNYPIIVLINKGSASAAEILAGSLRANKNALIVGETSFGKGSVQSLERLKDGSSIKISIAKWFTPDKKPIEEKGIIPDYVIEMTEEDYLEQKDPQLDKALELINKID